MPSRYVGIGTTYVVQQPIRAKIQISLVTIRSVFPGHVLFLRDNNDLRSSGCIERRNCQGFWPSILPQRKISSNSDLSLLVSKEDIFFAGRRLELSLKCTPAPTVINYCHFTFYSFFPILQEFHQGCYCNGSDL
jgi:hypothetical protein